MVVSGTTVTWWEGSLFFFCTDARLWRCVDGECIEIVEELIPFLGGFIFKQVTTGYHMLTDFYHGWGMGIYRFTYSVRDE